MENDNVTGQEQEQQEQGQQSQQQEQGGGEKTFTQAEVDTMINNRLARERKKVEAGAANTRRTTGGYTSEG